MTFLKQQRIIFVVFSTLFLISCNGNESISPQFVDNVTLKIVNENHRPIADFQTPIDNDSSDGDSDIANLLGPTDESGLVHWKNAEIREYELILYDQTFTISEADEGETITIKINHTE
ncbi:DUF2606 family protein [Shouchella clausii]